MIRFSQWSWRFRPSLNIVLAVVLLVFAVGCEKDNGESIIDETAICLVEIDGEFIEIELDVEPEYLNGGTEGFAKAISENLRYPGEARENGIEGKCIIHYEITEEGTVENVQAIQDPGGGIGDASIGVLEMVTEGISFSPGILNGNPVKVRKGLSLKFKIE